MSAIPPRRLVRTDARLATGTIRGGLTTRMGFPPADPSDPEGSREHTRLSVLKAIGKPTDGLAWVRQVHGSAVAEVDSPGFQGEADALITRRSGLVLAVSVADCCPVLLWSPGGALAAVHAGWRGLVADVLQRAIDAMTRTGTPAEELRAWSGPSIGPCCFEVGDEVATCFDPSEVQPRSPRPHVDLRAAVRNKLLHAGLTDDHIGVDSSCTSCDPGTYWSFRRDGGIEGRHVAFIHRV